MTPFLVFPLLHGGSCAYCCDSFHATAKKLHWDNWTFLKVLHADKIPAMHALTMCPLNSFYYMSFTVCLDLSYELTQESGEDLQHRR